MPNHSGKVYGKVYIVGAGPGDPELLTLKGKRWLEKAGVVLYDQLVNGALLGHVPARTELIYVGKRPGIHYVDQRTIEALLIRKAREGKIVVRLKGGDPFVFGRGGEEAEALSGAGIPYEIVPGVSSAIAAPAYAGIPLTHRSCASSVAIVTGHRASICGGAAQWGEIARSVDTLVILMGLHNLTEIMNRLIEGGCEAQRPIAIIESGTLPSQRSITGTVATIVALAGEYRIRPPAVIVVGEVARLAERIGWYGKLSGEAENPKWQVEAKLAEILDRELAQPVSGSIA